MAIGNLGARQGSNLQPVAGNGTGSRQAPSILVARQGSGLRPPPNPVAQFLARSIEPIVRPAVPDRAYRLLDRLKAKRPVSGELPEASVIWGGPSDFTVEELKVPEKPTGGGVNVIDDDDDEPDDEPTTVDWIEIDRTVHVMRVFNKDDSEQYVDVEVIDDITFELPTGVHVRMILNNP